MNKRSRLWFALVIAFALGAISVALAFVLPGVNSATIASAGAVASFWVLYGIMEWYLK